MLCLTNWVILIIIFNDITIPFFVLELHSSFSFKRPIWFLVAINNNFSQFCIFEFALPTMKNSLKMRFPAMLISYSNGFSHNVPVAWFLHILLRSSLCFSHQEGFWNMRSYWRKKWLYLLLLGVFFVLLFLILFIVTKKTTKIY